MPRNNPRTFEYAPAIAMGAKNWNKKAKNIPPKPKSFNDKEK